MAAGLDLEPEWAAQRRQRRLDAIPERYRPLAVEFAAALLISRERALRAGTRPLADRTIEGHLTVVRNLARFLVTSKDHLAGWDQVGRAELDAYLAAGGERRGDISGLLAFFSWARRQRRILVDPSQGLHRRSPGDYRGRLLTGQEQRGLVVRWTSKRCHPNEAALGMLCLLHAASVAELRDLTIDDIDVTSRAIRLSRRPQPLPLDPLTWEALTDVLAHRELIGATNRHVFVTTQTARRRQPFSTTYLHLLLGPLGVNARDLRSTRVAALAHDMDPRLVSAVVGMVDIRNALRYRSERVEQGPDSPGTSTSQN